MKLQKKILRLGTIAFGLAIFVGVFGVGTSRAQVIKEVLDRMDGNYKTLSSFRANVTMVKFNDNLGIPDTTEGTTSYLPKSAKTKNLMYVRIDWTKPVNESIVVIGDKYQLYRPKLGQAIQGTTSKAKNSGSAGGALAFISMSKAQLQSNYNVQYIGQEAVSDGTQTWHILMTPKAPTSYKSAELWVDANGMPRQAKITEQNSDTTTVLLTGIEKNADIKASVFAMDLPAGTKIVKG
ncbi:MAG: outer membrane lipoprotein carrier protein LolA [Acidobacteriota bacterium]